MSAQGVFTRMKRVRFVDGEITTGTPATGFVACGDGTAYPLEVTLAQIAEIFHRVEDAWFIAGTAYAGTGDPNLEPTYGVTIYASTVGDPGFRSYAPTSSNLLSRGYTTIEEIPPVVIDPLNEPYLKAAYDSGSGVYYRDISDNERGILIELILPSWNIGTGNVANAFSFMTESTAYALDSFFFYSGSAFDLDPPDFPDYANASVVFTGYVAVVKTNPANSVVAASNRFFLGVEFSARDSLSTLIISTNKDSVSGTPTELSGCRYIIRLSGSVDVSCPIYADNTGYPFLGGTDFIHEAQEWFPYAKAAGPVWNSLTGAKL